MNHIKQKTTPLSRSFALPLLTAIALTACSTQDASIAEKIKLQTATNPTAPLDLKKVGPPEWDRVCIFTPYSTTDHIEKHLGFKWNASIHSTISETLVFGSVHCHGSGKPPSGRKYIWSSLLSEKTSSLSPTSLGATATSKSRQTTAPPAPPQITHYSPEALDPTALHFSPLLNRKLLNPQCRPYT